MDLSIREYGWVIILQRRAIMNVFPSRKKSFWFVFFVEGNSCDAVFIRSGCSTWSMERSPVFPPLLWTIPGLHNGKKAGSFLVLAYQQLTSKAAHGF
jgi:hypothetical protein